MYITQDAVYSVSYIKSTIRKCVFRSENHWSENHCSDDVLRLIGSSVKSCGLDPISASLLLKCLDCFLPTLVRTINLSLSKGVFLDSLKVAKLTPILKKANTDHEVF